MVAGCCSEPPLRCYGRSAGAPSWYERRGRSPHTKQPSSSPHTPAPTHTPGPVRRTLRNPLSSLRTCPGASASAERLGRLRQSRRQGPALVSNWSCWLSPTELPQQAPWSKAVSECNAQRRDALARRTEAQARRCCTTAGTAQWAQGRHFSVQRRQSRRLANASVYSQRACTHTRRCLRCVWCGEAKLRAVWGTSAAEAPHAPTATACIGPLHGSSDVRGHSH